MQPSRKPLIFWCRWHDAKLHFHGRDDDTLWGELVYADGRRQPFNYQLATWRLTTGEPSRTLQLDEKGIERS